MLTHILPSNLCPTFFQTVLDVLLLVSLVVSQTSNEVIQGLFEPGIMLDGSVCCGRSLHTSWSACPHLAAVLGLRIVDRSSINAMMA